MSCITLANIPQYKEQDKYSKKNQKMGHYAT
jgi:hypothetical protein